MKYEVRGHVSFEQVLAAVHGHLQDALRAANSNFIAKVVDNINLLSSTNDLDGARWHFSGRADVAYYVLGVDNKLR